MQKKVQINGKWYTTAPEIKINDCCGCICIDGDRCKQDLKKSLQVSFGECKSKIFIETEPEETVFDNATTLKTPFQIENYFTYLQDEKLLGFIYPDSPEISTEIIKTKVIDGKLQRIMPEWVVFAK